MRLLEEHGMVVYIAANNSKKVNAHSGWVSINKHMYFIVALDSNSNTFFNQQFSLAHVLGHYVLHAVLNPQIVNGEEYRQMEQEAEVVAVNFLFPSNEFRRFVCYYEMDLDHYIALKFKWFISMNAMIMRARNLRLSDANNYLQLQKRISYHK